MNYSVAYNHTSCIIYMYVHDKGNRVGEYIRVIFLSDPGPWIHKSKLRIRIRDKTDSEHFLKKNLPLIQKEGSGSETLQYGTYSITDQQMLTIITQNLFNSAEVITLSKSHEQFAHTIKVGLKYIIFNTIIYINARI